MSGRTPLDVLRRDLQRRRTPRRSAAAARLQPPPPQNVEPQLATSEFGGCLGAARMLEDTLASACQVLGAEQGFFLVCRDEGVMEVASARALRPAEVIDTVLDAAAAAVRMSLRQSCVSATDIEGRTHRLPEQTLECAAPAVLCVPLCLGLGRTGLLCALRSQPERPLTRLDIDIVQALCEQASLTLGMAYAGMALAKLEASLAARPALQ